MESTKKVATKPKKRVVKDSPKVEMVSYSIKMVIPTGQYANIQPEIIVKAGSIEEAHNFIAPHMNKLWKEYYLVNERRPETEQRNGFSSPSTSINAPERFVTNGPTYKTETNGPPPDSSVALIKATQAIESCLSLAALDIIKKQIDLSVKLTDEDKSILRPLIDIKLEDLAKEKIDEIGKEIGQQ